MNQPFTFGQLFALVGGFASTDPSSKPFLTFIHSFPMDKYSKLPNFLVLLFICVTQTLFSQDYQTAWDALGKNDFAAARAALKKAEKNPATAADALLTTIIVDQMEGKDQEVRDRFDQARKHLDDVNPYYYAQWRDYGFAGEYGQKTSDQFKFLEQVIKDPKVDEGLKASAMYHLHHHYISKNEVKKSRSVVEPIQTIGNWQFTGAFDNVSESGFDKNYPPISQPKPDAKFQALNNSDIWWISKSDEFHDGWVSVEEQIKWRSGIAYAQSFITSAQDQDAVLALGYTASSLKIWVNDQLVFAEQLHRHTDFDVFKAPVKLKKGVNRVLLQIGLVEDGTMNFGLRFLDKSGRPASGLQSSTIYQPYAKADGALPARQPFYAVEYFKKKIAAQPNNLVNYFYLSSVYLRNYDNELALETIDKALALSPDNITLRFQRLKCLQNLENRTALSQEFEDIKRLAPESLMSMVFRYEEALAKEDYDEAMTLLTRWEDLYGEDESTASKKIDLFFKQKAVQEGVKLIEKCYKKYPTNSYFTNLQFAVESKLHKRPEAAASMLSRFLESNFDVSIANTLAEQYLELGMGSKAVAMYKRIDESYPTGDAALTQLANYYYSVNEPEKCKACADKLLARAPFSAQYWELAGNCAERASNNKDALANYQKSLHYGPNNYDIRRKIRQLENKPDFATLMPQYDAMEMYRKSKDADYKGVHDWYYILDERVNILYPERNSEQVSTIVIKVLNEAGIDRWKESSIGYNSSTQSLIIEKAEVLKPNGSKLSAEQNDNALVFTNLQVGDGIHVRYRLSNYAYGRMAREFTQLHTFNKFVPAEISRYCLLAPPSVQFQFKQLNQQLEPKISDIEEGSLKKYLWEAVNEPAVKQERSMPGLIDLGKLLHVSTIPNWSEVANWYADVSSDQAKRDYEVQQLYKTLFPADKKYTETEKARIIYHWITKNIRYSSVPFRQSGLVPQKAARVIQTKLGDCKDLATLFAALAREAGLEANLVLINTRDEGENALLLPSIDFNHCIVKVKADGQIWFLELTDADLVFGSLPTMDIHAFALEIPFGSNRPKDVQPFFLEPTNRVKDFRTETTKIEIKGRELLTETDSYTGGRIAGGIRGQYKDLPVIKRSETMQGRMARLFTNPLTIKELVFDDFDKASDTMHFKVKSSVKNEVMQIGDMQTIKVPFFNVFFAADAFNDEERTHPIKYWDYEDTDQYTETVTIKVPEGKQFSEIPKDINLSFGEMKYALKYKQTQPGVLEVKRDIQTVRNVIPPDQYANFRNFVDAVIAAETRWVAFK